MRKLLAATFTFALAAPLAQGACRPVVRMEPPELGGSRPIEQITKTAVIRNYLEAWQSLRTAFATNDVAALDRDYTGTSVDKLSQSIREQATLGLTTDYCDLTHDIQIIFYSPEGLSIQLIDRVAYDMRVLRDGKPLADARMQVRYVAVLTPSATRWRVRILEAGPG